MPVRARSCDWIVAIASLPPSRNARSASSSASMPGAMVSSSPISSGGRSTSIVVSRSAQSRPSSQSSSIAVNNPPLELPWVACASTARTASATCGKRASESPRARNSRGVARPAAALLASRSTSRTPSSASRRLARPTGSRTSTVTASRRRSMAPRSSKGASSHCRSMRCPMGVVVRSSTDSNVPASSPPRSDSTNSRFRRVISSSGMTPPGRSTTGRARCGNPPGCSSRR